MSLKRATPYLFPAVVLAVLALYVISSTTGVSPGLRFSFVLLLALAHFLTDAGFAGAAILCIGSDDHRAVESQGLWFAPSARRPRRRAAEQNATGT